MFDCSFSLFWKPIWCWWWPPVWTPRAASWLGAGVGGLTNLTNLRGRALVTGGAGELRLRPGLAGPQPRGRGQGQHQGVSGGGTMVSTQPPLRWVTPGPGIIISLPFQRRIWRSISQLFSPERSWATTHIWLLMEVSMPDWQSWLAPW